MVSEAIGLDIQILVADELIFANHCPGLRSPAGLFFEQLLNAYMAGIICIGGVPGIQQQSSLRRWNQINPSHCQAAVGCHGLQHGDEIADLPLDGRLIK